MTLWTVLSANLTAGVSGKKSIVLTKDKFNKKTERLVWENLVPETPSTLADCFVTL